MKIYISGPMRGIHDYNRAAFNAVAARIEANGHYVLNPAMHPDGWTQREYMLIDLAMVAASDAVFMLPNWEPSKGAKAEKAFADAIGVPVHLPESEMSLRLEWGDDSPPPGFMEKLAKEQIKDIKPITDVAL